MKIKIYSNVFPVIIFLFLFLSYSNTEHDRYFSIGSVEEKFICGGFPGKVSNITFKTCMVPLISFRYSVNHKLVAITEYGNVF